MLAMALLSSMFTVVQGIDGETFVSRPKEPLQEEPVNEPDMA